MRKVVLRMNENFKYDIIKNLVNSIGNKARAALTLNCSLRTSNRLVLVYKQKGKDGFIHGNRDKKSVITISCQVKDTIVSLYDGKYQGSNFTHFRELLLSNHDISISYSAIYKLLKDNDILSPKCERSTCRKNAVNTCGAFNDCQIIRLCDTCQSGYVNIVELIVVPFM